MVRSGCRKLKPFLTQNYGSFIFVLNSQWFPNLIWELKFPKFFTRVIKFIICIKARLIFLSCILFLIARIPNTFQMPYHFTIYHIEYHIYLSFPAKPVFVQYYHYFIFRNVFQHWNATNVSYRISIMKFLYN